MKLGRAKEFSIIALKGKIGQLSNASFSKLNLRCLRFFLSLPAYEKACFNRHITFRG